MTNTPNDSLELYQALMGTDPVARDEALQTLGDWLYRLARRRIARLAEECAQKALIRIWQKRATVQNPAAFSGWCATVLNGVIVDTLRREGGTRQSTDPDELVGRQFRRVPAALKVSLEDLTPHEAGASLPDTDSPSVEAQVTGRLLSAAVIRRVVEALVDNNLSDNSRAIITGGYLQHQSDAELAATLAISRGNVQVTRHRNLKKLRRDNALLADLNDWRV